jgi:hypothetical protein
MGPSQGLYLHRVARYRKKADIHTCPDRDSNPVFERSNTKHTWDRPFLYIKIKVKLSLCFNWAPRHEGVLGEWWYSSTHSLTSALDGGEWSASRPGRFTPRERASGTHWIGGWVGPRTGLDAVVKKKNSQPLSGLELPIIQPIAQRYTTELYRLLC